MEKNLFFVDVFALSFRNVVKVDVHPLMNAMDPYTWKNLKVKTEDGSAGGRAP